MALPAIVETGLNEAGTAVAVIVHPERGAAALFEYVNQPFAAALRRTATALTGATVQTLLDLVVRPECRARLLEALEASSSIQHDMPLSVDGAELWFGARLSFPQPGVSGVRHAILIGRDITQARKAATAEEKIRQLLMQVFMRVNVPVAIVGQTGEIVMCNAAHRQLTGYSIEETKQLRIPALTTPEQTQTLQAARDKQFRDGQPYEIDFDVLGKGGKIKPTRLTSVLLSDNDQLYRVTTLLPRPTAGDESEGATAVLAKVFGRAVDYEQGEVRAISLDAVRAALGPNWERIGPRAMLRAEQTIRKRTKPADLISRSEESRFVIWFDGDDRKRNQSNLEAMTRELRVMFLTEFGADLTRRDTSMPIPILETASARP